MPYRIRLNERNDECFAFFNDIKQIKKFNGKNSEKIEKITNITSMVIVKNMINCYDFMYSQKKKGCR